MEGAGIVREDWEVSGPTNIWRVGAGVLVLVVLGLIGILLVPPYYHNLQFERFLGALVHDPVSAQRSPDLVRALVVDRAASMGIPVHSPDVHVTRIGDALKIEVLYVVHIDLPVYTVDLHFRPGA